MVPKERDIYPDFKKTFIKAMRDNNVELKYCQCGAHPKVKTLNFSTIEIDCCNHLGCMTILRSGPERYEEFCLRAIKAWNYGEYEHTH